MADEEKPPEQPTGWHSRSADAAAARYGLEHPEEDPEHPAPPHVPEPEDEVPNRHSASAEAANLRWREKQAEE